MPWHRKMSMFIIDERGNAKYADAETWTRWRDRNTNEDLLVGRHHIVRNADGLVFHVSDRANLRSLETIVTVETKYNANPAIQSLVWETRASGELMGGTASRTEAESFHNRTLYWMEKKHKSKK
jgi:hypothetical protein